MTALTPIEAFVVTLFFGLVALAALSDVSSLRIPNRICAALAGLYPVYVLAAHQPDWLLAVGIAVAVFVVGAVLFGFGVVGGGDVKLLAAIALWAGPQFILELMLMTSLIGGAIAIMMMTSVRFVLADAFQCLGARDAEATMLGRSIPYGVAIAAGAYLVVGPSLLVS